MCLNWKCSDDSTPENKRVLIYDQETKIISGADFIKAKNENYQDHFVLDMGGVKKMNETVFYCESPKMDQHVLNVYKNHLTQHQQ